MAAHPIKRKIMFVTGTRADFGKLKPLMKAVSGSDRFICHVFVTGMHTLGRYGCTMDEIYKENFKNIHVFMNQFLNEPMELVLANTIGGLSRYIQADPPDMIVVHGDRIEALACAIVGALRNILVAHIEGGEISGTVDELIRHSVSKLSHLHFVANEDAAKRLRQLGERDESIFTIGSPDIDIMLSNTLPAITDVKRHYEISFRTFAIVLFHPVTTDLESLGYQTRILLAALIDSQKNYVVIYPNNDAGCDIIITAYERLIKKKRFRVFPSLRFEAFLALLQQAEFIIGNSSAGIREAPIYSKPSINIGSRQHNRFQHTTIFNVDFDKQEILHAIENISKREWNEPSHYFGKGNSFELFMKVLNDQKTWTISKQKYFNDLPVTFPLSSAWAE